MRAKLIGGWELGVGSWRTLLVAAALTLSAALSGNTGSSALAEADLAWQRGDYPNALEGYLALLDSPDRDAVLPRIALQTGELFTTIELTADGDAPAFSPDGRFLTYEVGRGMARRTRVARVDDPRHAVLELPGTGAAFSPDGSQVAYLKLSPATDSRVRIAIRDLRDGTEVELPAAPGRVTAVLLGSGGVVLSARTDEEEVTQIFRSIAGKPAVPLTTGTPSRRLLEINRAGTAALFVESTPSDRFGVISTADGSVTLINGSAPGFSGDGERLTYVSAADGQWRLMIAPSADPAKAVAVRAGIAPLDAPALSPDGDRVAFQIMRQYDWELHVIDSDGTNERRLTTEVQHDRSPRFLTRERLLGVMGEPRHQRSYLYDAHSGERTRLFHNNTVRTIAPEYRWAHSPDGNLILIVADRDGDTISPARGVYLTDMTKTVTPQELRVRLEVGLAAEKKLRQSGHRTYAPISVAVERTARPASIARVWGYQHALSAFGSRHISRPGNSRAADYLFETYRSFGYEPEYQAVPTRDGQTANVIATLRGTANPDLVYVVSSHYDSVEDSPGADDNASGTAALLEAARLLAGRPQPATIVFASFTGEESGLIGSREFVRRAVASNLRITGALNNDMIGWANDGRLDNTIRYTNSGIRDIQHAAAIGFSRLITYDARYVRGTDAQAYYDEYGDIVGGIGSYPVLGSPHYHQPHDLIDTIDQDLVTEVAKVTVATVMLLASSPSPIKGLQVDRYENGVAEISWNPSPEPGVVDYLVSWGPPGDLQRDQRRVAGPGATIRAPSGTVISVRAVNEQGLEGWDSARITLGRGN